MRQALDSMVEAEEIEDVSVPPMDTEDMSKMDDVEWREKNADSWEGTRDSIKFSEKLQHLQTIRFLKVQGCTSLVVLK